MPYGNSNKASDWAFACGFWVLMVFAAWIISAIVVSPYDYGDGYRRGYVEGYKKAYDEAVEVVERQISEIENRRTNH